MNTASTISQRDTYKLMLKDYPDVMSMQHPTFRAAMLFKTMKWATL